ncbi:endonuclease/exonuclease/phosphatase family protein [Desulfosporosinus sp. FKA]|uniref:endonuclease/exonuclease/phosphatase family protein n=1 Tax=Desulfosporosinus sp. FKA TaxID=1969834 RepID=UPI000B4A1A5C|nr:endonuclease/exonuclease/phosphatase family protein [Desulfosporosinus sp. FKA]
MKVMSYNTLFGGFDETVDLRFKAQATLINTVRPDILLIQEAKNFHHQGGQLLFQMEAEINMRGFIAVAPHTGQNTGIFINPDFKPIAFDIDSEHFHHAIGILKLKVPGFNKAITVISAHLCPFGPHVRLREAYYLTNYAAADEYALVAGDFNSVSPYNEDPIGLDDLPTHFRTRYVTPNGKEVDKTTLETLYQAGYIDIAYLLKKHNEATVPAKEFIGTEFVPFRSDYILTTQALSRFATSYHVIKDSISDYASDHYPIVAEFKVL